MKIVICASMSAAEKIMEAKHKLENLGHEVVVPANMELHLAKTFSSKESTEEKIKDDLIKGYFKKISQADALLALNYDKNGITNYIGGNTFLEIGFAHVLNKKIFLLNPIPEMGYTDEILAMQPIILEGDLTKIV
jgi:predicted RNA-binding protein with PUA domain